MKYSGVLDVQNVQVIPFMIENGGSKRISESQVLPGLQISLLSRLALKIVVGARELLTGNREQEESFGRFYFSSHTFKFFSSPT